jgi:hypothetical protein
MVGALCGPLSVRFEITDPHPICAAGECDLRVPIPKIALEHPGLSCQRTPADPRDPRSPNHPGNIPSTPLSTIPGDLAEGFA